MPNTVRNWRMPVDKVKLGPKFGVKDAEHPNGHRGTDFNGFPAGTPVRAVCNDMTIVMNKWSDVLGNVVVAQIGSRFFGYCHLQKPSTLKLGSKISSGGVVGYAGTSGSASTGVHLHFTLSDHIDGVFSGTVEDAYAFLVKKIAEEKK
jgi:murein DD-endopeptidase MepM/ murein hydrolase activator NlpD